VGCLIVKKWRTEKLLKIIQHNKPKNICSAGENVLFFRLSCNKTLSLKQDPCNSGKNARKKIMVLLACSADRTDTLSPLVIGRSEKAHCFKNVRKFLTRHVSTETCDT
jgi:hypothetical protein